MNIQFQEYDVKPILSHLGVHRTPLSQAPQLLHQAVLDTDEANRYMRMFYIFQGTQQEEFSLELQRKALAIRAVYKINLNGEDKKLRVLAIAAPGDMMQNLPLDYLLEDQGIEITVMYLQAHQALPSVYPEHDVTVFALAQSSQNEPILAQLCELLPHWPRPYINHPRYISRCARDQTYQLLGSIEGLKLAKQERRSRKKITQLIYPCTIRPVDSHAGQDFELLYSAEDLLKYLETHEHEEFYLSDYINYQSPDGYFKKFRVALIDGFPLVAHLAIGEHWVVSYVSAHMELSSAKRQQEADFMHDFNFNVSQRYATQFRAIHDVIQLDYLVLDCALSEKDELIIFEIDNSAWVHNTDPIDLFPYKDQHMRALISQFSNLIHAKHIGVS
jgi:hypothetical protein